MLIFQIIIYGLMINQDWYHNHEYYFNITIENNLKNQNITNIKDSVDNNIDSYEGLRIPCCDNTIIFMYYYLQSIITIIIFSFLNNIKFA